MTNANLDENGLLPPVETFTGHNHTLREDIDDLTKRIRQAEAEGINLFHPIHTTALLYNLQCAVKYLEEIGIKTFAEDRSHENTRTPPKVDVEGLKREVSYGLRDGELITKIDPNYDLTDIEAISWACIDHLASQGYFGLEPVKKCNKCNDTGKIDNLAFGVDEPMSFDCACQDGAGLEPIDQWQPIETAPQGVWILIFAYGNVCQACWNANGYWHSFKDNRIMPSAATHWMPLPQPPKAA